MNEETKSKIEGEAIEELKEIAKVDAGWPEKIRFSIDLAIRRALTELGMARLVAEWEKMDEVSGRKGPNEDASFKN